MLTIEQAFVLGVNPFTTGVAGRTLSLERAATIPTPPTEGRPMVKEAPFDAWDGEDLETTEVVEEDAAEVVAMHVEPDTDGADPSHWSELTGEMTNEAPDDRPVTYFDDEQPEQVRAAETDTDEQPEPDLEDLLERQHYAFPQTPTD